MSHGFLDHGVRAVVQHGASHVSHLWISRLIWRYSASVARVWRYKNLIITITIITFSKISRLCHSHGRIDHESAQTIIDKMIRCDTFPPINRS